MTQYRRSHFQGGTYFFTVVTYNRLPIFLDEDCRKILHNAWMTVQAKHPFQTDAVCLLPNHIHCIWALPEMDSNYSVRWKEIKRLFTRHYLEQVGPGNIRNASHLKQGEAAIWQRRFWEHSILDDEDLNRHRDYIHYNPVKHGLVTRAADWPWSSFQRFVRMGYYEANWGEGIEKRLLHPVEGE